MNILVCGANGFVGRHLSQALSQAGHTVRRGVRNPTQPHDIAMDYRTDTQKSIWLPRLDGISVVINAVGVLRDHPQHPMSQLHADTPKALFSACAGSGVERIIQLSALGVDRGINTPYFNTRLSAEALLDSLPGSIKRLILRPSLIYGHDGASARMFRFLARMPIHVLPGGGPQRLQPVHINDICDAVVRWLGDPNAKSQTISAVGDGATTMRGMLDSYREQDKHAPALHLSVPAGLMRLAARIGDVIPSSPLCSDTLSMLSAGNTADSSGFATLLGRPPLSYRQFISLAHSNG